MTVTGRTEAVGTSRAARSRRPLLARRSSRAALSAVVLCVIGAGLFDMSLHAVGGNSDGATVILEGKAIQAGNVLLHGWSLSLDSFWSIDALFNAVAVGVAGVRPLLLQLVPSIIAVLVIATSLLIVRWRNSREGVVIGSCFVLAVLALPSPDFSYYFLQGPLHIGTALWCLLAFYFLRRQRIDGWWILATVLLALAMLGDLQGLALGAVPVLVAGLIEALAKRRLSACLPLVGAAVGAGALAVAIRVSAVALGTYRLGATHNVAHGHALLTNVANIAGRGLELIGARVVPVWAMTSEPAVVVAGRAVLACLLVAGVLVALWSLLRRVWRGSRAQDQCDALDNMLLLGFFADLVIFVVLSATSGNYSRYLTDAVIFGAILSGRLARTLGAGAAARATIAVGAAALFAVGFGYVRDLAKPRADVPLQALSQFLVAHHLSQGLADYPTSAIVTVETSERVRLRPVVEGTHGKLVRFERQSSDDWYRRQHFEFLVFNTVTPWRGVSDASAIRTFGPYLREYSVDRFHVLVWSHPISVAVRGSTGVVGADLSS